MFVAKNGLKIGKCEVGDIVSYKCMRWSPAGLPLRGVIYRIRKDITWDDVIAADRAKKQFFPYNATGV